MSNETSSTNEQVTTLKTQVFALVNTCPAGRVTTYGPIATVLDRRN
jgi:alkylated DNA nucleotide flippase Atl1